MTHTQGEKHAVASPDKDTLSGHKQGTSTGSGAIAASPHHDQGGHPTRQGSSTYPADHQTATYPPLTHQHLTNHECYHIHAYTSNDINPQAGDHTASVTHAAAHTATVTAAGRSLGFDLSEPVYGETIRRYDGMTPAQRFLAEKDRAEYVRAVAGKYINGFHGN